jgi:hypothetical protein
MMQTVFPVFCTALLPALVQSDYLMSLPTLTVKIHRHGNSCSMWWATESGTQTVKGQSVCLSGEGGEVISMKLER